MHTFKHLLGSKIKLLRKSKGMSQAELAEASGVEINTISRYETGTNAPSIEQLLSIAEVLGVSHLEILPPQDSDLQRMFVLRQSLTEKALQINSSENLEKLVQFADALIQASDTPKK